jgi:hypothetical protein
MPFFINPQFDETSDLEKLQDAPSEVSDENETESKSPKKRETKKHAFYVLECEFKITDEYNT